jgi:hypothetical protein
LEILKLFINYGVVAVLAYYFVTSSNKQRDQNNVNFQTLFNNMIKTNNNNVELIMKTIKKLSETIENSARYYDNSMAVISQELLKLKQDLISINARVIELIINDKPLNDTIFIKLCELLIEKYIYILTINITKYLDDNMFVDEAHILEFREFVLTEIEINRGKLCQEITKLDYNSLILTTVDTMIENVFTTYSNNIENQILVQLQLTDLMRDHNHRILKKKINNKLLSLLDNILTFLKNEMLKK